jgi:hypothetical protein
MITYKDALDKGNPRTAQPNFTGPMELCQYGRKGVQLEASMVCTSLCHRLA